MDERIPVKDKYGNTTGYRGSGAQPAAEESKINKPPAGGLGALAAANRAKKTEASEPKAEELAESAISRQLRLRREAKEKAAATPYPQSR